MNVQAQSSFRDPYLTPEGERRDQTFQVLEFENGLINQKYDGILRYYCTFRGKWSKERHPQDFPRSPSFSAPVFISHSNGYRMWTGTETATLGVESIAEVSFIYLLAVSISGLLLLRVLWTWLGFVCPVSLLRNVSCL